ncbi:MAG: RnfABCDGE type electron transport complex subunit B, partial [Lachnospiraceae bacterium]|nr:RnfABCDGE type electron transport complex subunit B [Lachnospiraceae bacterium]
MSILTAVAVLAATGIFIGIFLGIAGIAFHVEENPIEEAILTALPGNNCGGCGFPGCSGLATAIAAGEAKADACPVGGESVATQIAELIGQQIEKTHRKVAYVHCAGQADQTTVKYRYDGPKDCNIMQYVPGGGSKQCSDGCLGYGSCVAACAFDAIRIQNGVAVVIKER